MREPEVPRYCEFCEGDTENEVRTVDGRWASPVHPARPKCGRICDGQRSHAVQSSGPPGYCGDLHLLESVQRKWTKQIESVEGLEYGDRLSALNLYSVQGRLIGADLIQYWKIFNEKSHIVPTDLFQLAPQTGTRGHCFKIFLPTIHTDVRKRFFNARCISTWNSLPQHVVTAHSVSCFKKLLAEVMGDALFEYVP